MKNLKIPDMEKIRLTEKQKARREEILNDEVKQIK